jgi:hypothetical protein
MVIFSLESSTLLIDIITISMHYSSSTGKHKEVTKCLSIANVGTKFISAVGVGYATKTTTNAVAATNPTGIQRATTAISALAGETL